MITILLVASCALNSPNVASKQVYAQSRYLSTFSLVAQLSGEFEYRFDLNSSKLQELGFTRAETVHLRLGCFTCLDRQVL